MGFLVGNDFIPHLPNMHITNGALPILYKAYMDVLPTLDGYINEGGTLNLKRFEAFIVKLSCIDIDTFTEKFADLKWFQAKTGQSLNDKMNKHPVSFTHFLICSFNFVLHFRTNYVNLRHGSLKLTILWTNR